MWVHKETNKNRNRNQTLKIHKQIRNQKATLGQTISRLSKFNKCQ